MIAKKVKYIVTLFIILYKFITSKCVYNSNIRRIFADYFLSVFNNIAHIKDYTEKFKKDIIEQNEIFNNMIFTDLLNKLLVVNPHENMDNAIEELQKIINTQTIKYTIHITPINTIVTYKFVDDTTYIIQLQTLTYHYLQTKLKIEQLTFFVLLYDILGNTTGQFWGVHPKVYTMIQEKVGNDNMIECFASPFNHNLDHFYSPLPELDIYFGSKGDFFDEFINSTYNTYVINPPFVESILIKTFEFIMQKLVLDSTISMYIYIPKWDDIVLPFLDELKKYNINIATLRKDNSIVYIYIKQYPIIAKFDTYIISINDQNIHDKIIDIMTNTKLN